MNILQKPVISEKMTRISEKSGRYGFIVNPRANKIQIKKAVESMYNVVVTDVNTMTYRGKSKTRGTKAGYTLGRTPKYKKAIVTLKQGDTIDFYSSI
ncbi:MAG TPA: 50S ribosomal protein L23 [Bacteroidia bacterium]|nr:50S ribosomal protein L23 [Bacteroidia bacterium]